MASKIAFIASAFYRDSAVLAISVISLVLICVEVYARRTSDVFTTAFKKKVAISVEFSSVLRYIGYDCTSLSFDFVFSTLELLFKYRMGIQLSKILFDITDSKSLQNFLKIPTQDHTSLFKINHFALVSFSTDVIFNILRPLLNFSDVILQIFKSMKENMAVILILIILAVYITLFGAFIIYRRKYRDVLNESKIKKNAFLSDTFVNLDLIKSFDKEEDFYKKFRNHSILHSSNETRYHTISETIRTFMRVVFLLMTILTLIDKCYEWNLLNIHEIQLYIRRTDQLAASLLVIRNSLSFIFEHFFEIKIDKIESQKIGLKCVFSEPIVFDNVFEDAEQIAVNNGQAVAFLGHDQVKRDKLVNAIFYEGFYSGSIKIGNVEVRDVNRNEIYNNISYMPAEQYFFDNSIAFNISFGTGLTQNQAIKKCKNIGLGDFFESFPSGYSTIIGNKSYGFSSGQIQMICFARCILREAPVYILENPACHMDKDHEKLVFSIIAQLKNKKVILFIPSILNPQFFDKVIAC